MVHARTREQVARHYCTTDSLKLLDRLRKKSEIHLVAVRLVLL